MIHLQSIERLKRKRLEASRIPPANDAKSKTILIKSNHKRSQPPEESDGPSAKVRKRVSFAVDVEEAEEATRDEQVDSEDAMDQDDEVLSRLPPGFFEPTSEKQVQSMQKDIPKVEESKDSKIPKGFFDDPVQDAKVRNVPFKNPLDEEWEKFQKEISGDKIASDQVEQDDFQELNSERTIEEIDQQIDNWAKVDHLQKKVQQLLSKGHQEKKSDTFSGHHHLIKEETDDVGDEGSEGEDDDLDPESLMDWRSKKTLA